MSAIVQELSKYSANLYLSLRNRRLSRFLTHVVSTRGLYICWLKNKFLVTNERKTPGNISAFVQKKHPDYLPFRPSVFARLLARRMIRERGERFVGMATAFRCVT